MITTFADPFDGLLSLRRELESRFASDWLQDTTTSRGPFPPINVFQQDDDILVLMELPGIDNNDLQVQAQANTVRIFGKKRVDYSNDVSVHRRERVSGDFDRTLALPVQVDPDRPTRPPENIAFRGGPVSGIAPSLLMNIRWADWSSLRLSGRSQAGNGKGTPRFRESFKAGAIRS